MDNEEIRFKDLEMEQTEFLDASAAASSMQRRLAKAAGFCCTETAGRRSAGTRLPSSNRPVSRIRASISSPVARTDPSTRG